MAPNLPSRYGFNPGQRQIDPNRHDANDPKHLGVIFMVVPEDDGEDDTAQIARGAGAAGDDTYK